MQPLEASSRKRDHIANGQFDLVSVIKDDLSISDLEAEAMGGELALGLSFLLLCVTHYIISSNPKSSHSHCISFDNLLQQLPHQNTITSDHSLVQNFPLIADNLVSFLQGHIHEDVHSDDDALHFSASVQLQP